MNDRELLELAAIAAGVDFDGHTFMKRDRYSTNVWDPLNDDGDAFRLAVHLGILLRTDFIKLLAEMIGSGLDQGAATRRSIVLIAAKIGELKGQST